MSMQGIYVDSSSTVEIENMEVEKVKNEYGDDYFLNVSIITDNKYRKLRYTAKLKLPLRPVETLSLIHILKINGRCGINAFLFDLVIDIGEWSLVSA